MLKPNLRTLFAILHDWLAAALAWWAAYQLRFNFETPILFTEDLLHTLVWVVPVQGMIFWGFGLYRGIWRYASVADLRRILFAVLTATASIALALGFFRINVIVPRSVLFIDPLLLLLLMGGSRLIYRLWKEGMLYGDIHLRGEPVLVMGAGQAGINLARELAHSKEWHQVGFLDDAPENQGRAVAGIRVLGKLESLPGWARRLGVKQIIIALPEATHQLRKQIIDMAAQHGIKALLIPALEDMMNGRVAVSQLRAVELDDLLGRDPVALDTVGLRELIEGNCMMVTGAGGSIGSELCRQILRFKPGKLVLLEASELALYKMEQELMADFPDTRLEFMAGDVRDRARIDQIFAEHKPEVVFHAAAYKHVPLMENQNAWQAVRNNVYGSWCVASASQRHGAKRFVLISTDKAVNPTNVMGASKRLAEIVCQGLQQPLATEEAGTRFVMVRFGNVLGSTGSVIPKFREQLAKGGPLTVTHPEITRYFMSIPEAAQLVLQAGLMGKGGEIFVLDMGEPVKIVDLARDLIRLSGLKEEEVGIEFTGLRPGEKLYEELLADSELTLETHHPKLRIAQARPVAREDVDEVLQWVCEFQHIPETAEVRRKLKQWVPEYTPAGQ